MVKRLPLFLIACCFIALSFKGEEKSKTYWYKSSDNQGYISIQKAIDKDGKTTLTTRVNANFDNEKLDFSLSTTCDTEKMVNASKMVFDGTIDSNMDPVSFKGERVKSKKTASYWAFDGDFKKEMSIDPEVHQFVESKHKSMIRIPARTIPSFNVLAVVPNLKFDRKGTFKFNSLDETKLYVKKNHTINYLGEEETDVDGKKMTLHKFVHQGKKMKPAYYWVNNSKELVKLQLDGKFTFTMSEKEAALLSNNVNIAEGSN